MVIFLKILLLFFIILFFIIILLFFIGYIEYKIAFNKRPIEKLYEKRKKQNDYIFLTDMPKELINVTILLEDLPFFLHKGINYQEIYYAFLQNIRKRRLVYGASTITMQLCKNLYSNFNKNILRKIKEYFMAKKTEKVLNKYEILEFYLNIIYFDNGQYGISNASNFYFGKKPKELTYNQIFFLIVLFPVVGIYNPYFKKDEFNKRMLSQAKRLYDQCFLSEEHFRSIINHNSIDFYLKKPNIDITKYNTFGPLINEVYNPKNFY